MSSKQSAVSSRQPPEFNRPRRRPRPRRRISEQSAVSSQQSTAHTRALHHSPLAIHHSSLTAHCSLLTAHYPRAFTLIELLIVLLIIATLSAAAIPGISETLDSMKASALARQIAADLRYAQTLAVQTGASHRIAFDTSAQSYTLDRLVNTAWATCTNPVSRKTWSISLATDRRYAGLRITAAAFGNASTVSFDKYGTPDNGGHVTFVLGSIARTLRVAPLSGNVTVEQ